MITISGNFYELITKLFYYFLIVSQTLYDMLTYSFDLSIGTIDLGIVEIPLGLDITIYPSMMLGTALFGTLMGLRFVKKFVPMA